MILDHESRKRFSKQPLIYPRLYSNYIKANPGSMQPETSLYPKLTVQQARMVTTRIYREK